MPRKLFYSIIVIVILAILGGGWYFFFYLNKPAPAGGVVGTNPFTPFGSGGVGGQGNGTGTNGTSTSNGAQAQQWPKVRELYASPIGGFVASTTASSTFVRIVDRGTGFIYDMDMNSAAPVIISNTTVPLIYDSLWQKNGAAALFEYIKEGQDDVTNFYVELRRTAPLITSTASSTATSTATTTSAPAVANTVLTQTPYELRGSYFPGNVIDAAVSPSGKQLFTIEDTSGSGVGFISNFDGSASKQIFSTPLEQVNAFWPTADTLMMATKGSSASLGYLYSINIKTGALTSVLGGLSGLSILPSPNGNLVLYSDISNSGSLVTSLYNIKNASSQDLPFVTLADKCVWSSINPLDLYCAIPYQVPTGTYPDDWYKGTVSTIDAVIEIDTDTGTVHPVSDLRKEAGASIDAEWLALDPKEHFLYFVNKKDLSLWSIDLNQVGR